MAANDVVLVGAVLRGDGSLSREAIPISQTRSATPDPSQASSPVVSRDVTIDHAAALWVRIFLPDKVLDTKSAAKLPVVLYFHGGGFVSMSASFFVYHNLCEHISKSLGAMVVSVDYRLAPEHRLPAAYDDGFAALQWLGENTDPWLVKYADLSSVFVMGDSSGANLVHHLIVRAARRATIAISGSILIQPSFGSTERKPSEMDKSDPSNKLLPSVVLLDRLWELALPPEASRDHPSCNVPLAANDLADLPMPPSLVVVGGLDAGLEIEGCRPCKRSPTLQEKGNFI